MSFLLGSLTDGLFGGARSVMSLYGMYQQIQAQDSYTQQAQAIKDAQDQDAANADTSTGGSAAAAGRHPETQTVAPDVQAPADTTTTSTPVFDTSKLRKANAVSAALGIAQGAVKTDPHTNVGPSLDATRAQTDSVVNPSAQAGALATGTPPGAPVYAGGTSTQPAPAPDMAAQRDAFIRQRGLQLVGPPVKGATAVENGQRRQQANDAAAAEWDKSHAAAATASAPASTVVANPSAGAGGLAAGGPAPSAVPTGTTPGSPLAAPSLMQLPPPQVGAQASALPPMYDPATPPGAANVGSKLTNILSQFNPISPVAAATPGAPPPVVPPHVAAASAGMPGQAPAVPPPPAPAPAPASPSAIQAGPPPGQPGAPGASTVAATQPVPDQEVKGALQHLRDTGAARQPDAQVAPAPVPAADAARGEKPAGGPSAVTAPSHVAPVAPDQMGPVLQSEPTPTVPKPIIDPQYYNALTPNWKAMVDRVAAKEGVDPVRLAAHWWVESRMKTSSPDSPTGAQGILQVQPETRDMPGMDPQHLLDPQNPEGSMTLGARYMNLMDRQFGRNTALSALAYVAGPQNAMAVAQNPAMLDQMPQSKAALNLLTGGRAIDQASWTGVGDPPLPRQILDAAKRGPDAFQNYIIQNAAHGAPLSDGWRRAETAMMVAAAMHGDTAGISHARDLIFQLSHQGMFEHLMKADQFMRDGNGQAAATEMANSHAFVPDGVVSQFGVGKDGSVWGRQMDPNDPTKPMAGPGGQPTQITSSMIQNHLAATADPQGYLKWTMEQQKAASEAEERSAKAHYYEDANPTKMAVAQTRAAASEQRATLQQQAAIQREQEAARQKELDRIAAGERADIHGKQFDANAKAVEGIYGANATAPPAMPDGTPMSEGHRAAGATIALGILNNAGPGEHTPTTAAYIANNVVNGTFKIGTTTDGNEAIINPQTNQLVAVVPKGTRARAGLAPPPDAAATPGAARDPRMSSEMPSQAIH